MKFHQLFVTGVLAVGLAGCSQAISSDGLDDVGATIDTAQPATVQPATVQPLAQNPALHRVPAEIPVRAGVLPPATSDHLQGETGTDYHAGSAPYHASDNLLRTAQSHFREGRFGLAEQKFRKAVEVSPRDAEAWVGLAASYDRLRRFDLADRAYDQAIKLIGRNTMMLNNLGYSQLLRGDLRKARQHFLAAYEREPDNPIVRNNLELLNESAKRIIREKA